MECILDCRCMRRKLDSVQFIKLIYRLLAVCALACLAASTHFVIAIVSLDMAEACNKVKIKTIISRQSVGKSHTRNCKISMISVRAIPCLLKCPERLSDRRN
ncbi:hypothetical protein KIN20_020279 [Parelaphostrongylus tenuis]|uniref:Uncharacterized protein n=1 Tax=Parelaphostrongylus tenuis TaxID=148309 RepID=A0AAD5N323_PARTN|nr:hypothetical protein KIN20_020279 [Parelaphostrongylus tenuis]